MSVVSFLGKKAGAKKKRFFSGHFSVIGFLSAWIRRIVILCALLAVSRRSDRITGHNSHIRIHIPSAWIRRIVYSMFFVMAVYLVIGLCTILIPSVMGYVIGSLNTSSGDCMDKILCASILSHELYTANVLMS